MPTRPRPPPRSERATFAVREIRVAPEAGVRAAIVGLVPSVVTVKVPIWLDNQLPAASLMPEGLIRMTCPAGSNAAGRIVAVRLAAS